MSSKSRMLDMDYEISLVAHGNLYLQDAVSREGIRRRFSVPLEFWFQEKSRERVADSATEWLEHLLNAGTKSLALVRYYEKTKLPDTDWYKDGYEVIDTTGIEVRGEGLYLWIRSPSASYIGHDEQRYEGRPLRNSLIKKSQNPEEDKRKLKGSILALQAFLVKKKSSLYYGFLNDCLALLDSNVVTADSVSKKLLPPKGYAIESHQMLNVAKKLNSLFHKEGLLESIEGEFLPPFREAILNAANHFDYRLL